MRNKKLLQEALTHSSYLNEDPSSTCWERLEFLGDAVLELAISEALFALYPESQEGYLTQRRAAMVNQTSLAVKAREIEIGLMIYMGKGEDKNGGRNKDSILADALEALIGAYFLDRGYLKSKGMILKLFKVEMESMHAPPLDFKSMLQEYAQRNTDQIPTYKVAEEKGTAHARIFMVRVSLAGFQAAKGAGTSKKVAEQNAAHAFLEKNKLSSDEMLRK
ncbi:MAG: ribonuclease III [Coprothermobacterota bacterium]|nr:ribonuclease III [Coprothermobacterota bacterium]